MTIIDPDNAALNPDGTGGGGPTTVTYSLILSPDGSSQISLQPSLLSLIGSPTVSLIEIQPSIMTFTVGALTVMDATNALITNYVDAEWVSGTGPVVRDTVDNSRWRIVVTSGVLGIVAA